MDAQTRRNIFDILCIAYSSNSTYSDRFYKGDDVGKYYWEAEITAVFPAKFFSKTIYNFGEEETFSNENTTEENDYYLFITAQDELLSLIDNGWMPVR
jgi:hypothetical protein